MLNFSFRFFFFYISMYITLNWDVLHLKNWIYTKNLTFVELNGVFFILFFFSNTFSKIQYIPVAFWYSLLGFVFVYVCNSRSNVRSSRFEEVVVSFRSSFRSFCFWLFNFIFLESFIFITRDWEITGWGFHAIVNSLVKEFRSYLDFGEIESCKFHATLVFRSFWFYFEKIFCHSPISMIEIP